VRGKLRIYLGAAPGVGKTFAMLAEGGRRTQRGTDVVIGPAVARGLAEAKGGHITPEETPGGGVTMSLTLPTCNVDGDNHHEDHRATDRSCPANPRR
jgi:K+-sensing histidine kinase KdpD